MLVVAAILGFIIGYISRSGTIDQLEGELASTERAVDDCRQTPAPTVAMRSDEAVVMSRIQARATELDFGRLGHATLAEADDLKVIEGIGPFLERKLHAIGIYRFEQIARFTPNDVELVNDIIEFFPGRIQRDNWVGQAKTLAQKS